MVIQDTVPVNNILSFDNKLNISTLINQSIMKKLSFLILLISIQAFCQTSVETSPPKTVEEVLNFNRQATGSDEDLNKLETNQ